MDNTSLIISRWNRCLLRIFSPLFFPVFWLQTVANAAPLPGVERGDRIEQFKSFISSPPDCEIMFVQRIYPHAQDFPTNFCKAIYSQGNYAFAVSHNEQFMHQNENQAGLNFVKEAYGKCNSNWWNVADAPADNVALLSWVDAGIPSEVDNRLIIANRGVDYILRGLLFLGVEHAPFHPAIKWNGDMFSITNQEMQIAIHGTLQRGTNSFVRAIKLGMDFLKLRKNHEWIVHYEYSPVPLLGFLPTSIRTESNDKGKEGLVFIRVSDHQFENKNRRIEP